MTLTKHNNTVVVREGSVFVGTFHIVSNRGFDTVDFVPRIHDPVFLEFSVWEAASKCLIR